MIDMAKTTCPRCGFGIPNDTHRGEYPGALSRTDNATEVCSECGVTEAMEQFAGRLIPQTEWWAAREFGVDARDLVEAEGR